MARVFVSYRRADGRLAVDWIAERLAALDAVDGVESAFHDAGLRIGDDFAAALDAEIDDCEIVVAVIGPEWEGRRPDGSARIRDADDWVVRELKAALDKEKTILPVLIGDAPPPLAADLHPDLEELPGLHSLPLTSGDDLDKIVDQVAEIFAERDREEATRAGLEHAIEVPDLLPRRLLVTLILLGAIAGASAAAVSAFAWTSDSALADTDGYAAYGPLLVLYGVFIGATLPVGALLSRRIVETSRIRWRDLAVGGLVVASVPTLIMSLTSNSHLILADAADLTGGAARAAGSLSALFLTLACWVVPVGAAMYATPRAADHEIGGRVAHLAVVRDAQRWAILVAAGILTIGTAVSIALEAARENAGGAAISPMDIIAVALILSAVVVMLHRWAVTAMTETQNAIRRDAARLPEPYAGHATGQLAAMPLADGAWGFRVILALPTLVALIGVALATR